MPHVPNNWLLLLLLLPLADRLWSAGHDAAADWLLNGLPFYLMLVGRLAAGHLTAVNDDGLHLYSSPYSRVKVS